MVELQDRMRSFLVNSDGCTRKHLKAELINRYSENFKIVEVPEKGDVVSVSDTVSRIFHHKWYTERCSSTEDEHISCAHDEWACLFESFARTFF